MTRLRAERLVLGYGPHVVIDGLDVALPTGRITAVVGGNGSGKSTLLKAFSRVLEPMGGAVHLDDADLHAIASRALARRLSFLPQSAQAPDSLTAGELVAYGRYPHRRWLRRPAAEDHAAVQRALAVTGTRDFAERPIGALSGGQRQRVWIAMTLAQGAEVLLLDEPTSALDPGHQLEIMALLARLNRDEARTVVVVMHDLNLAARYASHMIAMAGGRIIATGAPEEVMTEETLRQVFGIRALVMPDPLTGTPMCVAWPPDEPDHAPV